ncbi:putative transcription factor/ chromatin remodeling BED-type(Zn) family [Helianthus anomalus]
MSSYKESNENPAAHVDLTDGEDDPNPIIDESGDTDVADTATGRACKKERKKSSDVHPHFVDVQGLYKGKMVPKKQCIYCKHTYVRGNWSSTTSMKRHLQECGLFKKAQGIKNVFSTLIVVKMIVMLLRVLSRMGVIVK